MFYVPQAVEALFVAAGWDERRNREAPPPAIASAAEFATAVLSEFAGLHVPAGEGRRQAAGDVRFLQHPGGGIRAGRPALGDLAEIASAYDGYASVLVDARGRFYLFTDPDGRLYCIGHWFGEAMERVLLGFDLGAPLAC